MSYLLVGELAPVLLESLPHKVWVADPEGRILYTNASLGDYLGVDAELFRRGKRDWTHDVHPDDRDEALRTWSAALTVAAPYEAEYRLRRADGAYRLHVDRAAPVHDPEGVLIAWVGTLTDVADQRSQEAELRESRRLFAEAEQIGGLGAWELDLTTLMVRISGGFQRLFEVDADIVPMDVLVDRLHPDDRERAWDTPVRGRVHPGPEVMTYRLYRQDGTERVIEVRRQAHTDDAREHARVEATLWSQAAEDIPMILTIMAVDAATGVPQPGAPVRMNRLARTLLPPGRAVDAAREERFWARHYTRALATEAPVDVGDLPRLHPESGARTFHGTVYPLAGQGMVALVGIDVTELRELEAARRELTARAAAAGDAERQRIAEHLHDGAVQALIAALLRLDHAVGTGDLDAVAGLRPLLEDTVRSLRLTMLELAPLELVAEGLGDAVDAYARQVLDGAPIDTRIAVEGDTSDVPQPVLVAAFKIVQEALTNVRKHAGAGHVEVAIRRQGTSLDGWVRDDGVGTDQDAGRAGHLGLRLMRERAEVLGGRCAVVSDGTGTTVSWSLPLHRGTDGASIVSPR